MISSVNFYQNFKENIIVFSVDVDPGAVYKVVDGVRTPISYTYSNQTLTTKFEQVGEFDVILNGEPKITHFENDFVIDDSSVDTSSDFGSPVLCEKYNASTIVLPIFDHSVLKMDLYNSSKQKFKFAENIDYGISNVFKGSGYSSQPVRTTEKITDRYGYSGIFERISEYNFGTWLDARSILYNNGKNYVRAPSGKYYVKLSNLVRPQGNDIINRRNSQELYNQEYYFEIKVK